MYVPNDIGMCVAKRARVRLPVTLDAEAAVNALQPEHLKPREVKHEQAEGQRGDSRQRQLFCGFEDQESGGAAGRCV